MTASPRRRHDAPARRADGSTRERRDVDTRVAGPPTASTSTPPVAHLPMTLADLDVVLAIEASAYGFPWSRGNFVDALAAGYCAEMRLAADGRCIGYVVAMVGYLETHLLNLTVAPAWQRQGQGRSLLLRLCGQARARGDRKLWLEVRASNLAARRLYEALGFTAVGLRRRYYPAPQGRREDALVMSLDLDEREASGDGLD